jgi:hypothetical protein
MSRFWTTETSARAKGRKAYPPQGGKQGPFTVLIDFRERYPYRFPGCVTERQNLPAGDYGLFQEGCLIAVVERKTPEKLLCCPPPRPSGITHLPLPCGGAGVLLRRSPQSQREPLLSPSYIADILAELTIQFPDIPIVFCGNRKHANEWTFRFLKKGARTHLLLRFDHLSGCLGIAFAESEDLKSPGAGFLVFANVAKNPPQK